MRLHQNAQRLLETVRVVNPYAEALTFLHDRTRTRRDQMKYLTLIRAVALLHQHQRPRKVRGAPGEGAASHRGDDRGHRGGERAVAPGARAEPRRAVAADAAVSAPARGAGEGGQRAHRRAAARVPVPAARHPGADGADGHPGAHAPREAGRARVRERTSATAGFSPPTSSPTTGRARTGGRSCWGCSTSRRSGGASTTPSSLVQEGGPSTETGGPSSRGERPPRPLRGHRRAPPFRTRTRARPAGWRGAGRRAAEKALKGPARTARRYTLRAVDADDAGGAAARGALMAVRRRGAPASRSPARRRRERSRRARRAGRGSTWSGWTRGTSRRRRCESRRSLLRSFLRWASERELRAAAGGDAADRGAVPALALPHVTTGGHR